MEHTFIADYNSEMKLLLTQAIRDRDRTKAKFQQFMQVASREVWNCDPKVHVEGELLTIRRTNIFVFSNRN